jgi:hypothetical protein
MAPHRLSAVFKDIHVNDIFIVVIPSDLEGSARGNCRVIAHDNPVFSNVDVVKAHFFPNRNVRIRRVRVLQDAPASSVVLAHGTVAVLASYR